MNLVTYLSDRPRGFKTEFAKQLGISKSFLWQVTTGYASMPPHLAKKIEALTKGKVKKSELRPDLWG